MSWHKVLFNKQIYPRKTALLIYLLHTLFIIFTQHITECFCFFILLDSTSTIIFSNILQANTSQTDSLLPFLDCVKTIKLLISLQVFAYFCSFVCH